MGPILSQAEAHGLLGFSLAFELLAIWKDMHARGRVSRRDLDPLQMGPRMLPHLVIINVLENGQDYQWRLFGGAHIEEYGVDVTGLSPNHLMSVGDQIGEVKLILEECFNSRDSVFYCIQYQNRKNNRRNASGVIFPLFKVASEYPENLIPARSGLPNAVSSSKRRIFLKY